MAEVVHPFYRITADKPQSEGSAVEVSKGKVLLGMVGNERMLEVESSGGRLIIAVPVGKSQGKTYAELWPSVYPGEDYSSSIESRLRVRMHRTRKLLEHTPYPILSTGEHPPKFYYEDKDELAHEQERHARRVTAETDFSAWDSERTFLRYNPHTGLGAVSQHGERIDFTLRGNTERPLFELLVQNVNEPMDSQLLQGLIAPHSTISGVSSVIYLLRKKLGPKADEVLRTVSGVKLHGVYELTADVVEIVDSEWNIRQVDKDNTGDSNNVKHEALTRSVATETNFSNWDSSHTFIRYNPQTNRGAVAHYGEPRGFHLHGKVQRTMFELLLSHVDAPVEQDALAQVIGGTGCTTSVSNRIYYLRGILGSTTDDILRTLSGHKKRGIYTLIADFVEIVDRDWNVWQFNKHSFNGIATALRGEVPQTGEPLDLVSRSEEETLSKEQILSPATTTDLSVIALGIVSDSHLQQRFSQPGFKQPSPETFGEVIDQTDFPEEETPKAIKNNHILTSLCRVKALIGRQEFPQILEQLYYSDTASHDVLEFLYRINQQQGEHFDLDAMSRHFESTGARRNPLMEELVLFDAASDR